MRALRCGNWAVRALAAALAALSLSLCCGAARAQSCTASITAVNFGSATAANLNGLTTVGTISEGCTRGWATFGTLSMCNSLGAGANSASAANRTMKLGGGSISYQLYYDPAFTQAFAYPGADVVSTPYTTAAGGSTTQTIYAKILSSAAGLPTGTYTDTYATTAQTYVTFDATAPNNPIACGPGTYVSASPGFTVSVNLAASCAVSAFPLSFGAQTALTSGVAAATSLSVTCTQGTGYTVALGAGTATGATTASRKMTGPGGALAYGLYRDLAHTANWGVNSPSDTYAGTGNGAAQSVPVYGLLPAQPAAAGSYSDTIVVTLTY